MDISLIDFFRLMAEEGVDRAEAPRLASEALPKNSTLVQAVMCHL